MRSDYLVCWRCGETLATLSLPLGRMDECPECKAQLHVCRMCRHFDERYVGGCRHDHADKVQDKERANFCQFFRPRGNAHAAPRHSADPTRARLEDLFGEPSTTGPVAGREARERSRQSLGGLFGNADGSTAGDAEEDRADQARRQLDSLFGKDG